MVKQTIKKYASALVFVTLIMIIFLILNNLGEVQSFVSRLISIVFPFILGLIFALVLLPMCNKFEKLLNGKTVKNKKKNFIKRHSRGLSVFISYIIVILIIALLIKFAVPTIYNNIVEFVSNIPVYYNNIVNYLNNVPESSILYGLDFSIIIDNISVENIQKYFDFDTIFTYLKGVFNFASAVFSLFVAIILSIYILIYRSKIVAFMKRVLRTVSNKKTENTVTKYLYRSITIFSRFIAAQFLDAIIIGTLCSIALLILDVKYALALGFLIGIANMIPYFGAIFATIFVVLLIILTGGIWKAITVLIVILILQQIDANIINPKILSENLKMNPMLVIFAVTIGGGFFGILGMFLSVPIFAVLKTILMEFIENKEKSLE